MIEVAPSNKRTEPRWLRRLWGYLMRHRRNVVLALAAAVLGSASQALVPLIARTIVDDVIVARDRALWPWLLLLIGSAVLTFALAYVRRYRGGQIGLGVQYELRNDMHDHLQRLDLTTLGRLPTGQLVARANSDSALIQGLLNFLPLVIGNLLGMLISLAIMFVLSPMLALLAILVLPAMFTVSYRMRSRVYPATWDAQLREGDVAQIVDEDVTGVRVVKAFGQEERELRRLAAAAQRLYGARMRATRLRARYQPLLETIPVLAQVAVLAVGGWLALHGRITIGTFLAFSTYVGQFVAPARQLAGVLTVGQQARAGAERILQLLDLRPSIADAADAAELAQVRGEIVFEDVHFSYDHTTPVLRGIDLRIKVGERIAFVGPSGSGKSTLAALVARFYDPDQGRVLLDGHDLRALTLRSLRRGTAYAFEESFLFSDTVASNIAYGRPDASRAAVEAAAVAAQADQFICELPAGYDTVVGERGLTLSGGQRQRIALARAILADPRVLVLDDATSAVDARTEEAIQAALRGVLADRTTLLIAHRLSTLNLAERIVVLDRGRVVDDGTHDELVERSAFYRRLLLGLEDDLLAQAGDSVEALAELTAPPLTDGAWEPQASDAHWQQRPVTAAAWQQTHRAGPGHPVAASVGPGLGATPELVARVAALRPIRDTAEIDVATESRRQRGFTLARLLSEFRRPLLVGLVLVVLDALAGLAGPYLVKTGVDSGVAQGSQAVLFAASAAFLAVTLADLLDQTASTYVTGRAAERIMLSLRVRIWAQLQRLSLDYYEREMSGRVMTRMITDVDQFQSLVQNGLLSALVACVTFLGVGVTLVVVDVELGLLTLSVIVPLTAATIWFRRRASRLYDVARDRIAAVNADFQESLSGVREAQAFGHESLTVARFHNLGRDYLRTRVRAQRLVATYFPFVQFLSAVADAIVLGVGAGLITSGRLSTGALIAFILYVDMFFSPIQQLSQVFDSWQQTRVSVRRIAQLMELETLTPAPDDPIVPGRLRGELSLQGVRFAYPGGAGDALRGVDLHVAAGETVALVGETGAGKSTVLKLLARFYDPSAGHIAVDGVDLRSLDTASFHAELGYVPQEAFLFTGTVRDNIAYGRPAASDEEVEAAARAVGAHELVAGLAGGYLHELGERGASLSSGQRQLIALARAELVDPALLLLDEATSNVDLDTEARVSAAIRHVAKRRTTIVIAHRLQTARAADRIALIANGVVAESGTHDELIRADGRYAAMWRAFDLVGQR